MLRKIIHSLWLHRQKIEDGTYASARQFGDSTEAIKNKELVRAPGDTFLTIAPLPLPPAIDADLLMPRLHDPAEWASLEARTLRPWLLSLTGADVADVTEPLHAAQAREQAQKAEPASRQFENLARHTSPAATLMAWLTEETHPFTGSGNEGETERRVYRALTLRLPLVAHNLKHLYDRRFAGIRNTLWLQKIAFTTAGGTFVITNNDTGWIALAIAAGVSLAHLLWIRFRHKMLRLSFNNATTPACAALAQGLKERHAAETLAIRELCHHMPENFNGAWVATQLADWPPLVRRIAVTALWQNDRLKAREKVVAQHNDLLTLIYVGATTRLNRDLSAMALFQGALWAGLMATAVINGHYGVIAAAGAILPLMWAALRQGSRIQVTHDTFAAASRSRLRLNVAEKVPELVHALGESVRAIAHRLIVEMTRPR